MVSNSHSDFLPTARDDEFLPPIGNWIRFGGLFVIGIMALAIPVASVTKYKETVKVQASLRPAGELRLIQAATEGQVIDINVEENQPVKKGEAIATIDNSRLLTKKSQLQSNIQQSQLQLVQMNAQIAAINSQIAAETDRSNRAVASAIAELDRRQRDYRDRTITSAAEVEEAEANLWQTQEELEGAQANLRQIEANLRSTQAAFKAAQSKYKRYRPIAELGALSQDHLEEAKLDVDRQEQAVEAQKASVQEQQQTIERLQQALNAARAKLRYARAALDPSTAEMAIAKEAIARERATGEATLATLKREREALSQQRIEIQQQLKRDTSEIEQIEKDLLLTTIKAPADGVLFQLNLRNSGQTVVAGQEIAQIAPDNASTVIKALVPASKIGKVKTGQSVDMRVSACPYPDYGTLKGVVSKISPDAMSPQSRSDRTTANSGQISQAQGAAFYEVAIAPETLSLGRPDHQCQLQLGMEGRADIVSKEESLLKFVLRKARILTDL